MNNSKINYYPIYAKLVIRPASVLVLSYLIDKEKNHIDVNNGFFYQSIQGMSADTGLTHLEIIGARNKLKKIGVINEIKKGMPAKILFKINHNILKKLLAE